MRKYLGVALVAVGLAACNQDGSVTGVKTAIDQLAAAHQAPAGAGGGAVYTEMNQTSGNAIAIFARANDGSLTAAGSVSTGGTGTGAGLGSQGALALSEDGQWLYAVNAGSSDISILRVGRALAVVNRFASGGTMPISLTVHDHWLYVLNAGGSGNITGFTLDDRGGASPIPGSTRSLSGAASVVGPAEVAFSSDGRWLAVTEKNTNLIDLYPVREHGVAGPRTSSHAAGTTPFGFAFGHDGDLFSSEAAGTASSYQIEHDILNVVSGAVNTFHAAPCWLVIDRDNRFAYTANAHDGTISGFTVGPRGSLTLLDAAGTTATPGAGNLDLAFDHDSRYLYQLRSSGPVTAYRQERDGHLTLIGVSGSMPGAVAGLVAR